MDCLHELEDVLSNVSREKILTQLLDSTELNRYSDCETVFNQPSETIMKERPWKTNPKYFQKIYISSLALCKMSIHAKSGGSIEVMGMMTGRIIKNAIIVMDVYPLPVEGTETRVNAQAEGYEYMVQYLENLKQVGRAENIVGWYHSHPGYGCWLSGIDVATQNLNQNFQDPYLAVVIDPTKTEEQGKVEIGAFRTFPDSYKPTANSASSERTNANVPKSKQKDFGVHSERYYSLDIQIFKSKLDSDVLNLIANESWINKLVKTANTGEHQTQNLIDNVQKLVRKLQKKDINQLSNFEISFIKKFDLIFEEMISEKLSNGNRFYNIMKHTSAEDIGISRNDVVSSSNDDMEDESDLEERTSKNTNVLDVSDAGNDDAMSMESTLNMYADRRNDIQEEDGDEPRKLGFQFSGKQSEGHEYKQDPYQDDPRRAAFQVSFGVGRAARKVGTLQQEHGFRLQNNINKTITNLSNHGTDIGIANFQDLINLKTKKRLFLGSNTTSPL